MSTKQQWTGEDLEAIRSAAGISQADLARALGVRRQRVSTLEAGRFVTDAARRRLVDAVVRLVAERSGE